MPNSSALLDRQSVDGDGKNWSGPFLHLSRARAQRQTQDEKPQHVYSPLPAPGGCTATLGERHAGAAGGTMSQWLGRVAHTPGPPSEWLEDSKMRPIVCAATSDPSLKTARMAALLGIGGRAGRIRRGA